jgi:uncharacterized protein YjiS (DUF1127 family)
MSRPPRNPRRAYDADGQEIRPAHALVVFAVLLATARATVRRASIRQLEEMDDRELADLGISRSEIAAAVRGEL